MLIEVTQDDIDQARQQAPFTKRSETCPLARGFQRHVCSDVEVAVGLSSVHFIRKGADRPMALPEAARLFRKAFDFNNPVSPFSFEFQIPESLCQS